VVAYPEARVLLGRVTLGEQCTVQRALELRARVSLEEKAKLALVAVVVPLGSLASRVV
jgi:hypothetical protein